ncbi:MAG TPA: hypothetical protein GXZ52_02325 [Clostridiales bacterium]|nr:hypothetical protein [Clostridiales bacterium]
MALNKCQFCEKLFNDMGTGICVECMNKVDEGFVKVRKYIYQNPDSADFASIIQNTGVSERELNYLIDRGRIQIQGRSAKGKKCIICGAETSGGSLCPQCKQSLSPEKDRAEKPQSKTNRTDDKKTRPLMHGHRRY